jgi:pimeloyl-ACP methyl ester carboxylesterase
MVGEIRIARPGRARRPGFRVKLEPTISGGILTVCRVANRPWKWSACPARGTIALLAAAIFLLAAAPLDAQGPRLFYESDGDGTPVVLVPDWAHDTGSWFRILPLLRAEERRLIRYDLRGQGRSEAPADGDYSLAAHRADLLRLLDGLGIDRAHLAGTGLGGSIVLGFALEHPERVLSVTAAEPRVEWEASDRDAWFRLLEAWERIGRPTLGEYTSVLVERWLGTEFASRNGWALPWYDLMLRRQSAADLIASMRAWLMESAAAPGAPSGVPALVVFGEEGMTAFEGDWLESAFPGAWRERLEDSRLEAALDAPEELARRLDEFWQRTTP